MKKLISVLLTLVLLCSVCVFGAGAATVNVAPNGTPQLFYSSEPYEDISPVNGYVVGYIGDADGDGSVSVLDATEIQLHLAQLREMDETGLELSDVGLEGDEVSVLDATEIQLFIAQLSQNDFITRTLYYADYIEYTFDQMADYLITYGNYESYDNYYYTIFSPTDIDDVSYDLVFYYYPDQQCICFYSRYYQISEDVYVDTFIQIDRGNPEFTYGSLMYDDTETFYESYGYSELVNMDDMSFYTENQEFTSDYYSDFSEVQNICETQFNLAIAVADEYLWDYIDGYVTDIFW